MEYPSLTRLLVTVTTAAACGDGHPIACSTASWGGSSRGATCLAAQIFVTRDTASLIPSELDLDRYLDRWSRAATAEPLLLGKVPQRYPDLPGSPLIYTQNVDVISAWDAGDVSTGVVAFDQIIGELDPIAVARSGRVGDGEDHFLLQERSVFSASLLDTALASTSSMMEPVVKKTRAEDGVWIWSASSGTGNDDDTAQVDYTFGWGDCFVGCTGLHTLRAIISPSEAQVFDLGGDPLPNDIQLSPSTQPWGA